MDCVVLKRCFKDIVMRSVFLLYSSTILLVNTNSAHILYLGYWTCYRNKCNLINNSTEVCSGPLELLGEVFLLYRYTVQVFERVWCPIKTVFSIIPTMTYVRVFKTCLTTLMVKRKCSHSKNKKVNRCFTFECLKSQYINIWSRYCKMTTVEPNPGQSWSFGLK